MKRPLTRWNILTLIFTALRTTGVSNATATFHLHRGVRQVDTISPKIFTACSYRRRGAQEAEPGKEWNKCGYG